jgi:NAD(P)-dependent dehydrogenase (short-subunit alcohol dehydrogenase family)
MKTALVIGASRGLGLELVRQYRAAGWHVIATTRSTQRDAHLVALGAQVLRLDVTAPSSFALFAEEIAGEALDVAIYSAGILGPQNEGAIPCATAEFDAVMHTNVLGALHAVPVVAPRLRAHGGKFVFLSSLMGSIASQVSTRRVVYRASKCALNVVVKTASLEWGPKGIVLFALHPGWVKTDMGGTDADLEAPESILGMRRVIENSGATDNGRFYDYTGKELPW